MRTLIFAFCAGFGVLALSGGTPAQATPVTPALYDGETNAGVITVGRRDRHWRRPYYRGYAYRPYPYYYRPYAYYQPYYRPYAYYGYPYYYRRPGISFGFSF